MAMVPHMMTVWVSQGTAEDRRTGFVVMTRADFAAAQAQGRAQDPRVGVLHLNFIKRDLWEPPPEPPEPEQAEPEAQSLGAAATPTRRRRASARA